MTSITDDVISLKQVRISDDFWSKYRELIRNTVIPYQWKALNDDIPDAEPSFAIRNFKIAAGIEDGEFGGMVFQDSDVAKWLEAVAYVLTTDPDPALERLADETIDLIVKAQQPDGYLNTYYTIKEPNHRWTNLLECHELYCAGHMMEAAVAYYQATGKRKFLDAMCKFADYIQSVFGPEQGKINGYPGHQEIELALVKLYQVTGEDRYLKLSEYFINQRGTTPNFFTLEAKKRDYQWHSPVGPMADLDMTYNQSHLPANQQTEAVGHAVRAVYMYTAMADLARLTGDDNLRAAVNRLWNNITTKQMYISGGIGSNNYGEAFTFNYDLPNDTIYSETCASVGLIFFAHRMLKLNPTSQFADILERALYNVVISSMSLDGTRYFYVNPLEVWPEASAKNPGKRHVKATRQKWFGCSCCPPNVARLLSSLGQYIYTLRDNTIYTHLFIGSQLALELDGETVQLTQEAHLPWSGSVKMTVSLPADKTFGIALRVPDWCNNQAQLKINGEVISINNLVEDGYAKIDRTWSNGDVIEWNLAMKADFIEANPLVRSDAGKAAIMRGPLLYCVEEVDAGSNLSALMVCGDKTINEHFNPDLLGGAMELTCEGFRVDQSSWSDTLYRPLDTSASPVTIKSVPYYLWGNRGIGEMSVWLRVR